MAEEDIIFGKNRHFFGGIEPSNMKEFKAVYSFVEDPDNVTITAKLPNDTVINNQTLCSVSGAIIRRKKDTPPVNEFDGEFVADIKEDSIIKSSIDGHKKDLLVYAAFPYTTQGVYNISPVNRYYVDINYSYPVDPVTSLTIDSLRYSNTTYKFQATLRFSHPGNKYIEDSMMSQLAGIMIRMKTDGYPEDENDGELVINYTSGLPKSSNTSVSGSYMVTNLEEDTTYYFSAFPYNTESIYTKDDIAKTSIEVPTAELPPNLQYFKVTPAFILEDPVMIIDVDVPKIEGDELTVYIVRKENAVPQNRTDGTQVTTFDSNTQLIYNGAGNDSSGHCRYMDYVTGNKTYQYRAFIVNSLYVENSDIANIREVSIGPYWLFGFSINYDSSDPSKYISYESNSFNNRYNVESSPTRDGYFDNGSFTPAYMNDVSGRFEWGSWDLIPGTYFMPRPCILKSDGTVACYLNPHDYTKDEYGNSVNITSSGEGDVMLEFPMTYTSRQAYQVDGKDVGISFFIFNKKYRANVGGNSSDRPYALKSNYFYCSAYFGSEHNISSNKVIKSVSGESAKKYTNSDTHWSIVKQTSLNPNSLIHDDNRCSMFYMQYRYISTLLTLITKSTDGQSTIGQGVLSTNTDVTGTLDKKGLFWCDNKTSTSSHVKVFGIEDYWGSVPILGSGTFLSYRDIYRGNNSQRHQSYRETINPSLYSGKLITSLDKTSLTNDEQKIIREIVSPSDSFNVMGNQGDSIYISTLPNNSDIGNGFGSVNGLLKTNRPSTIDGCGARFDLPLFGLWSKSPYYKYLNGSSTTYSCDYIEVKNYPSTTNLADLTATVSLSTITYDKIGIPIIPVLVGGGETSASNQVRRGPWYRCYQTSMANIGTRISYLKQE